MAFAAAMNESASPETALAIAGAAAGAAVNSTTTEWKDKTSGKAAGIAAGETQLKPLFHTH
jgi:hypothetical protein